MEVKIWSKTALVIYRFLENFTYALDRFVKKLSTIIDAGDTFARTGKIMSLTDDKIDLINLKIIIDDILLKLPKGRGKLIILRYMDKIPALEIAELMGINIRTYFREINAAENSFEKALNLKIAKNEPMFLRLLNQFWIRQVYEEWQDKLKEGEGTLKIPIDSTADEITKMIMKNLKRSRKVCDI